MFIVFDAIQIGEYNSGAIYRPGRYSDRYRLKYVQFFALNSVFVSMMTNERVAVQTLLWHAAPVYSITCDL